MSVAMTKVCSGLLAVLVATVNVPAVAHARVAPDEPPAPEPEDTEPDGELVDDPEAPLSDRDVAASLFAEGNEAYELGQYERAIECFERAWKLAPEPELLFNLGQAEWRWFDIEPNVEHLRKARTFFENYDKRMRAEQDYFPGEVNAFITALRTQIEAEEQKQAARERQALAGPSLAELDAAAQRKLQRERSLALAGRLNGAGIGLVVLGSLALAVGIGGVITRGANGLLLDRATGGDPSTPNILSAEEDARRRNAYLIGGQVAFTGLIAGGVLLPIGIGLRIGGAVIERRTLGRSAPAVPVSASLRPGSLLTIEF